MTTARKFRSTFNFYAPHHHFSFKRSFHPQSKGTTPHGLTLKTAPFLGETSYDTYTQSRLLWRERLLHLRGHGAAIRQQGTGRILFPFIRRRRESRERRYHRLRRSPHREFLDRRHHRSLRPHPEIRLCRRRRAAGEDRAQPSWHSRRDLGRHRYRLLPPAGLPPVPPLLQ